MSEAKPYLPALSSSRFPPAIHVVIYHVILGYHVIGGLEMSGALPPNADLQAGVAEFQEWCSSGAAIVNDSPLGRNLLRSAAVTLSFFFTLSGFVLAYTYLEPGPSPSFDRRSFWANRFARIYPVYALALIITFPIFLVSMAARQPPVSLFDVLTNFAATILLLQSWSPEAAHAWNPPGWSLSCEAFFYLLFPWIAVWIDRLSNQRLAALMGLMWACSMLPPTVYEWLDPDEVGQVVWTTEAFWLFVAKFNPILRLPEFIAGVALGKLYLRRMPPDQLGGDGRGAWPSLAAVAAILAICGASESFSFLKLHNGLLTPLFALLIYALARGGGPIWATLRHPWMVLCGDATYALYILHYAIITYLMIVIALTRGRIMSPAAFTATCLGLGIIASILVYKYYEIPVRRFLRRKLVRAS